MGLFTVLYCTALYVGQQVGRLFLGPGLGT